MPIRLKIVRKKEEQVRKVKELMEMFKAPNTNSISYYQYQPIGASISSTIDPQVEKTRNLFEMFHLTR